MTTAASPSPHAVCQRELVEAAVLAPSPDNNQPWRFAPGPDGLAIDLDPRRALPSDVNSMFDLLGLGAAVENACIAARQLGFEPRVDYGAQPAGSVADLSRSAATITLSAGGRGDSLFPHLAARCTCRKLYSTRPLPDRSVDRMAWAARRFSAVELDWITDRPRIRTFARLLMKSDRIRFEYEPFHNEIFRQLRFSADEAERTRDGLDVRTLELPPGAGLILRKLRPWNRMKWVHRLGLGRLLTLPSALSVVRSGALGVLCVGEPTPTRFLEGGRALQRIWLSAHAEGLSMQPLGSLPIFVAHLEQLHGRKLSPQHERVVRKLIRRLEDLLPAARGKTLLIAFRLGYATAPKFRSLRRLAEDVTVGSTAEAPPP